MSVVHKLAIAIYETVKEAGPLGAPRGVVYLAMQSIGLSYENYIAMEQKLVEAELIWVDGQTLKVKS